MNIRALTLYQPWASSIVYGPKRIENRTWRPPDSLLGETFLIHAGKTYDKAGAATIREHWPEMPDEVPHGCIIGAARLIGVLAHPDFAPSLGYGSPKPAPHPDLFEKYTPPKITGVPVVAFWDAAHDQIFELADQLGREPSPWFFGPFGWVLDEVAAFPRPGELECRGYQTLWGPPVSLRPEIDAQLQEVKHVTT